MSISDKRIYLASRSPRRRELLNQIGIGHEMLLLRESASRGADVDETPYDYEALRDYALRVAIDKARAGLFAMSRCAGVHKPVLAADTTVALGNRIYGKPRNVARRVCRIWKTRRRPMVRSLGKRRVVLNTRKTGKARISRASATTSSARNKSLRLLCNGHRVHGGRFRVMV